MTDIFDLNVSFTGQEANTLFFEPVYMDADILRTFRVMPNVTTKKKMGFVRELEKVVRQNSGCGFQPVGSLDIYEREISVDRAKVDLSLCWDEFKDTVFEELLNTGVRIGDLTGTLLLNILVRQLRTAIQKDIQRLAFFGNRASSNSAYDICDGLFTVILPDFGTAGNLATVNAGSGTALGAGDAIDLLKAMWAAQPKQLRGLPNNMKAFWVDSSVIDQYRADIENGGGGDAGIQLLQDGREMFTFRGIPVYDMLTWNDILTTDFSLTEPHRALLTTPRNLVQATDVVGNENTVKIWYDEKEESVMQKARWKMGFNCVHPSLVVYAS